MSFDLLSNFLSNLKTYCGVHFHSMYIVYNFLSNLQPGGRTRGALIGIANGIMSVGREDDRENHRHNFGHAPKRLLLVGDLAPNPHFRAHDSLVS